MGWQQKEAQYYCEFCKVWLANHAAVIRQHENGGKHKEAVAAKIRSMRENEKAADREAARSRADMEAIERAAEKKFQEDDRPGSWEFQDSSGYFYNAAHRYYYDLKTQMYYGGTPPAWTDSPDLPAAALYRGTARTVQTDPLLAGMGVSKYPKGMKVGDVNHPQAGIGRVEGFGAKGGVQKKRFEAIPGRTLTKRQQREVEFQKKRDAARKRVEKRDKDNFGFTNL